MKTIIITLGLMLAISLTAQTKYYSNTKTFYESGYTYQCDVRGSGIATLYNKNNQWTYTAQIYAAPRSRRFVIGGLVGRASKIIIKALNK